MQAQQFRALGLARTGGRDRAGHQEPADTGSRGRCGASRSGDLDVSSKLVDRLKLARKLIRAEDGKA